MKQPWTREKDRQQKGDARGQGGSASARDSTGQHTDQAPCSKGK